MKKIKFSYWSGFGLLAILQVSFIFAIILENIQNPLIILLKLAILGLLFFAYSCIAKQKDQKINNSIVIILSVTIGAILTYFINHDLKLGPVIGAGSIGVIASFIPSIFPKSEGLKVLPPAIYTGAFVGMSGGHVLNNMATVALAGSFAGFIYILTQRSFGGFGGKLGTIAFGGVVFATIIIILLFGA